MITRRNLMWMMDIQGGIMLYVTEYILSLFLLQWTPVGYCVDNLRYG